MELVDPLLPNVEVVPGIGYVTWNSAAERLANADTAALIHHPHRSRVVLAWPLPRIERTCAHCAAPWPCSRYVWASGVLAEGGSR